MKYFQFFLLLFIFSLSNNLVAQPTDLTEEQQGIQKLFQNLAGTWVNDSAVPNQPNIESMKATFTPEHDNFVLEMKTFVKMKGTQDWQPEVIATYFYDKVTKKIHGAGMDKLLGYSVMKTAVNFVSETTLETNLQPLASGAPVIVKITHSLQADGSLLVGNVFYINDISEWKATFEKVE